MEAIKVNGISFVDKGSIILDEVSFNVQKKEVLTIVGPNGAGKSTLVKALLGIVEVSRGKISFPSYDKLGLIPKIGYVPQHSPEKYANFPLTVKEFITLNYVPYQKWPRNLFWFLEKNVDKALDILDILDLKDKRIDSISGGEFQKIIIAGALSINPDIIILDEPSIGLDSKSRKKVLQILIDLKNNLDCTIIIVSHDIEVISTVSSNVLYLDKKVKFLGKLGDYCDTFSGKGCFEVSDNHLIWHNH